MRKKMGKTEKYYEKKNTHTEQNVWTLAISVEVYWEISA